MKLLCVVTFILMNALTSSLPLEAETRHRRAASCKECPAGTYMPSCNNCVRCSKDTFTDKTNKEKSCFDCFMDCRTELHLQVVSPCSSVADVVCKCVKGTVCVRTDRFTGQCLECMQQHTPPPPVETTSQPPTQTLSHTVAQTTSYVSHTPEQSTLYTPALSTSTMLQLFLLVFALFILFSITTFCFYKRRKIDCLKKGLKHCSVRNQKEENKAMSSEINKPNNKLHSQDPHAQTTSTTETDCPNPQPASRDQPPPASGNLGPLHIYGAGTVFVSLLNQFGLNGGDKDEDDLRQQPLNNSEMHCPQSPTIPLSKEEKNKDISYISFPFQEQGKECHMSKEEGL
ncbi:uncharacterized protein Hap1MRO34_005989 [Clarias gariepinus]